MIRHFLIWTAFILLSGQASAVGFEQAKLHSHLGEPLHVQVALLLSEGEDFKQSKVVLATPQEYKNLEQRLPLSYGAIRVDVEGSNTRSPVVHITSRHAIDESILVLVLKVQRGRGNFYKKIQFFLDAIPHTPTKRKPVWKNNEDAKVKYSKPSESEHSTSDTLGKLQGSASPSLTSAPANSGWSRRSSYGPVQYGDSLSEIAYRLRKDKRWSNRQIMLALYQSNPDAFVNHDINQLKKGRFLNVPDDAAVRLFVESGAYQAAKPLLAIKRKVSKAKKLRPVNKKEVKKSVLANKTPKFHGRISLGLNEPQDKPIVNAILLKRLEKLEPLYKQAMASDLRMDGIGDKVDSLAKEVGQLHKKIDALALQKADKGNDGVSAGWIGFFTLLLLNILLAAAFYYRKQMKAWQGKLLDAQRPAKNQSSDEETRVKADDEAGVPAAYQVQLEAEHQSAPQQIKHHTMQSDWATDTQEIEPVREPEENRDSAYYAVAFEEKVHKRDWLKADEYYKKMDESDYNRPRIQALFVERLHGEGDILGRNTTLLTLFNLYDEKKWQRFCSSFDDTIWQTLQDEKIISYTGKVNQSQVDASNKKMASQPAAPETFAFESEGEGKPKIKPESKAENLAAADDGVLDLSDASIQVLSMDDFAFDDTQNSLSNSLEQDADELDSTFIMNTQGIPETKDAKVKVKDDDGLEVDFEFDFSVPDASETVDTTVKPKEKGDDPNLDGLSLELDDSTLEPDEKKD
ncbi:MAG: FimV/HubP family polar landmark protein [Ghiorsea sp.]